MSAVAAEAPSGRIWTVAGLAVSLLGLPAMRWVAAMLADPHTVSGALLREALMAAAALLLVMILRRGERVSWQEIGLAPVRPGRTALTSAIAFLASIPAVAVAFGVIGLLGIGHGSPAVSAMAALPLWLTSLVVLRAGVIEEFFYRGYAIERLQALTGSRALALALPLAAFTLAHWPLGTGGMILAGSLGAAQTAIWLWRRDLWALMAAHFLVDFIPNVVVPLVAGG